MSFRKRTRKHKKKRKKKPSVQKAKATDLFHSGEGKEGRGGPETSVCAPERTRRAKRKGGNESLMRLEGKDNGEGVKKKKLIRRRITLTRDGFVCVRVCSLFQVYTSAFSLSYRSDERRFLEKEREREVE